MGEWVLDKLHLPRGVVFPHEWNLRESEVSGLLSLLLLQIKYMLKNLYFKYRKGTSYSYSLLLKIISIINMYSN